ASPWSGTTPGVFGHCGGTSPAAGHHIGQSIPVPVQRGFSSPSSAPGAHSEAVRAQLVVRAGPSPAASRPGGAGVAGMWVRDPDAA
ncbi:unnamed protein product, partial [Polarella glacialis]